MKTYHNIERTKLSLEFIADHYSFDDEATFKASPSFEYLMDLLNDAIGARLANPTCFSQDELRMVSEVNGRYFAKMIKQNNVLAQKSPLLDTKKT